MLYQCLIFLRHTGLWEQMWETIRLNLILNLNLNRDSLVFKKIIDEKKLSKSIYYYIKFIIITLIYSKIM